MLEAATTEFWREIKPIANCFKLDALPEVYIKDPANSDERYFVPITETVSSRPVWMSPQRNMWADILMAKTAGLVNRHYHPHQVFAYTYRASGAISSMTGPRLRATSFMKHPAKAIRSWPMSPPNP
jgi:hypothetical protein